MKAGDQGSRRLGCFILVVGTDWKVLILSLANKLIRFRSLISSMQPKITNNKRGERLCI